MLPHAFRLIGYFRPIRGQLIFAQFCLLIALLLTLLTRSLFSRLLDDGVATGNTEVVVDISILMLVLAAGSAIFYAINAVYSVNLAEAVANRLRAAAYRNIQRMSFGNIDRFSSGELLVRLTVDVNNVKLAVQQSMLLLLQAPFSLILAVLLILILVPEFAGLLFAVLILVSIVLLLIFRGLQALYDKRQKKIDAMNNVLQEDLAGVRVVKAFVREEAETKRFAAAATDLREATLAPALRTALFLPTIYAILYAAIGVALYFGGRTEIANDTREIGQIVVFIMYMITSIVPLVMLAFLLPYIQTGETSLGRLFEVIDATAEVQDVADVKTLDPASIKGRVEFENVSFGYRKADGSIDNLVLKNINFLAEPGQTIGILGATGSGKTSLVNLIPRFYDVTEGKVTIDGIDVRDFPQSALREIVGIALQQAILFSGTVRGNLKLGVPEASDDAIFEAARAADADGFISNIPEGYDARVARRGANFSGGQRQRMSIARALLKQPKILILDDSTSAVDLQTEVRIQSAIATMKQDSVKIYIAQRISSVLDADKIIVLDSGRQVAIGNHGELLRSSELYREIYESQLGPIPSEFDNNASANGQATS